MHEVWITAVYGIYYSCSNKQTVKNMEKLMNCFQLLSGKNDVFRATVFQASLNVKCGGNTLDARKKALE